ncbi:ABC transporter ATP-binding protein [Methanosarcinaceae archaeon]|nr:ABC transporter ATP-binding protein [Methanosarcinaceae archaeon]
MNNDPDESSETFALSISGLSYTYPGSHEKILDDVSLEIRAGEKIAVVGANGAGKTTLFLHLNGIIRSMPGAIRLFGTDICDTDQKTRISSIGIVFADPDDQLFMPTVYDDVAFGPSNMGLSAQEVRERVEEALEMTGISGLSGDVSHHLSTGQKKMVALAAVLSMKPRILVLDEPTANIDQNGKKEIIRIIDQLHDAGTTTIIATHDMDLLSKMADRVYVLNKTIVCEGSPEEIFADPVVLAENGLEAPDIYRFFRMLSCPLFDSLSPPLCLDDAADILMKTADKRDCSCCLHARKPSGGSDSETSGSIRPDDQRCGRSFRLHGAAL